MGFMRSRTKSMSEEVDLQPRNRLSKPLTNKSQPYQLFSSRESMLRPVNDTSTSTLVSQETLTGSSSSRSTGNLAKNIVPALSIKRKPVVTTGIASLVARFESNQSTTSASPQLRNGPVRKRPNSAFFQTDHPLYTYNSLKSAIDSNAQAALYRKSPIVSDSPVDDPFNVPCRRPSTYKPGEAMRTTNGTAPSGVGVGECAKRLKLDDDSEILADQEETVPDVLNPPQQEYRAGTPLDLDRLALGNLSLGSLRITNGRASSVFSDLSIQPRPQQQRIATNRTISSEYPASDNWEDETVPEDINDADSVTKQTPPRQIRREFSYIPGSEARWMSQNQTQPPETNVKPVGLSFARSPNNSASMAQEYMAELPASPYAESQSGSLASPTGSVIHHKQTVPDAEEEDINDVQEPTGSIHAQSQRAVSAESQPISIESQPSTFMSEMSSAPSRQTQQEVYQSALEFQPASSQPDQNLLAKSESAPVDSGYNSSNSLSSFEHSRIEASTPGLDVVKEQSSPASKKETSPRKLGGFLPFRPVLRSRATAPAGALSLKTDLAQSKEEITRCSTATPDSGSPSKALKHIKRLQKKNRNSIMNLSGQNQEIVVQGNSSQIFFDIPAVSSSAVANLGLRNQAVPELKKAVHDQPAYHSGRSTPAPVQEIKFPSPTSDVNDDVRSRRRSRSKSRTRSKSRGRSVFSLFKSDKSEEKRRSEIYQPPKELNVEDFDDVIASLGSNPYDMAMTGSVRNSFGASSQRSVSFNPSNVSIRQTSRPRSMMDDRTASNLARSRSRSIQERDSWKERRSSFNDRGGIPGKSPRVAADAPPVPPMPHPKELRRISWRRSQMSSSYNTGAIGNDHQPWSDPIDASYEEVPAPPPPSHSPHPSFVKNRYNEEVFEDEPPAPPPPSHSPRPMDITPEVEEIPEDVWAAQARAWKARRQSAGERLRAKWSNDEASHDTYEPRGGQEWHEEERSYPVIPPRHKDHYYDGPENIPPRLLSSQTWDEPRYYETAPVEDAYLGDRYHPGVHEDQIYQYNYDQHTPDWRPRSCNHSPSYEYTLSQSRSHNSRPLSRHSHHSAISHASSLAEELHPPDLERRSPAPESSRYSGGLSYGYEGRDKGFGGSAGTRNVSGKAEGMWKGMALRRSCGIDLGDVPIMGVAMKT